MAEAFCVLRKSNVKHQRFLQHIISAAWILFCLPGCGAHGSTPTAALPTVAFVPPTPTNASIQPTATHALATSTETTKTATFTQTSATSTETTKTATFTKAAFPVTGSVEIEHGRSDIGGFEGDTIQVQVEFSATSPFGRVTKMRVTKACEPVPKIESADWEPFVVSKTYPLHVIINWFGFHVCVQFKDEYGNLSPVYSDDISVEGNPRRPLVNPTDWYPQIQCFSEKEVHPSQGEVVTGATIIFSWPNKNNLPDGVFYKVTVIGVGDNARFVTSAQTGETSIALQIPRERAGEMVWDLGLADEKGTALENGQCSATSISLFNLTPGVGLEGFYFSYRP